MSDLVDMRNIEQVSPTAWRVRFKKNGVTYRVGTFTSVDMAVEARDKESKKLVGETNDNGIFETVGVTASERVDEAEVYKRAVAEYKATATLAMQRASQSIKFCGDVACIVFLADQHLGDAGTDIELAFEEAELAASMPNTAIVTVGDLINQFVIEKLRHVRDKARMSVADEWVLARLYMRTIAPRWALAVAGNHDLWADLLTGVDWHRDEVAKISPQVIYDAHDCMVDVSVGDSTFTGRIRHQWRGNSVLNDTAGIERSAKLDKSFDFGVGGHTHRGGLARDFTVDGRNALAVLCGSYKRIDSFARMIGVPAANTSTAVAIIFDAATNSMTGVSNLDVANRVMRGLTQ